MSNQKVKKAAKLAALFIIISSSASLPFHVYSQNIDTAKIKKEISKILKKNGLPDAAYEIKVSSLNQKGGQTAAFIINNNYKITETHIVNGINNGFNGNLNIDTDPILSTNDLDTIVTQVKQVQAKYKIAENWVILSISPGSKGQKIYTQVRDFLTSKGYFVDYGQVVLRGSFRGIIVQRGVLGDNIAVMIGEF